MMMKYVFALALTLFCGAATYAAELTNGDEWRWVRISDLSDHWDVREGHATVEMKNGKISAELMLGGDKTTLYEISGTYRLGRAGVIQAGTIDATVTTFGSDFGYRDPHKGTYRKELHSTRPFDQNAGFSERIIISNGANSIGLSRTTGPRVK
jgi:hypothetical protein